MMKYKSSIAATNVDQSIKGAASKLSHIFIDFFFKLEVLQYNKDEQSSAGLCRHFSAL